jgi:hypothetical protein
VQQRRRPAVTTVDAPDARTWAAAVQPGTPVQWRALEVAAFRDHPSVLEQLDPAGRYNGGKRHRGRVTRQLLWAVPAVVVSAVVYGSPVWGFVTIASGRFRSPSATPDHATRIPAAGVLFAISLVLLVGLLAWGLRDRRLPGAFVQVQAWLLTVLGGLGAAGVARGGARDDVPGWELWTAFIGASAAIAVVVLVAHHHLRRALPEAPVDRQPLGRVRRQVQRLTPAEQQAVRDDVAAAVRDLADRGVVSAADAAWAQQADPGMLAVQMSQRRR